MSDSNIGTVEAAEMLGLDESRIRQMVRDGQFRAIKIGRTWVLRRQEVVDEGLRRQITRARKLAAALPA